MALKERHSNIIVMLSNCSDGRSYIKVVHVTQQRKRFLTIEPNTNVTS